MLNPGPFLVSQSQQPIDQSWRDGETKNIGFIAVLVVVVVSRQDWIKQVQIHRAQFREFC